MRLCYLLALASLLGLTGCAAMPSSVYAEVEHTSHPFAGYPFGPANEEDALTVLNIGGTWTKGSSYLDMGFGHKLAKEGFKGPELTFNIRAGYRIPLKKD